jgi:hypothetical protein
MLKSFFVGLLLSFTLLLTGCQSEATPSASPSEVIATPTSDILTRELPPEITAYGVVLAALYIATGDAEEAIAAGRVSPDEVYEAKKAIEEGTLDVWRERAELEIKGLTD